MINHFIIYRLVFVKQKPYGKSYYAFDSVILPYAHDKDGGRSDRSKGETLNYERVDRSLPSDANHFFNDYGKHDFYRCDKEDMGCSQDCWLCNNNYTDSKFFYCERCIHEGR